jgi:hypothetical protein
VRCELTKAFEIVQVPFNKDLGPSKCGHEAMPNERALHDPATLALANCVAWLSDIKTGKPFEGAMAAEAQEVTIDQKGCRYVPHVQIVRRGARLWIKNSDPVEHNIQGFYKDKTRTEFNVMSSSNSLIPPTDDTTLTKPQQYLLGCSIHPWMSGCIWSASHPYVGVSGLDGVVLLTDVPPGEYEVACWHEGMAITVQTLGTQITGYAFSPDLTPPNRRVTVTSGATTDVVFQFEPR